MPANRCCSACPGRQELVPVGCQAWGYPHVPPASCLPWLAHQALPIQTSPNCPFPSFLRSWRDSRGISHTSLVLTERSASLGVPLWHGTARRQHSPAARSAHGAGDSSQGGHRPPPAPCYPPTTPGITKALLSPSHPQHTNGPPSTCPRDSSPPTPAELDSQCPQLHPGSG